MRDKWFGDNRDLVKWGVLFNLADSYKAGRILQIPYFRTTTWGKIKIDGKEFDIPQLVISHFRDMKNILKLNPCIEVLDLPFKERNQYKQAIVDKVNVGQHPCIVFLDPDTGLEPQRSQPGLEHVLESELLYIWDKIPKGDVLVFYQHQTNRRGQPWVKQKCDQFEKALGLPSGSAKVARSREIARDVAFYYCCKGAI